MKKVLSISLGSTSRDHTTEADFMGEHFWLEGLLGELYHPPEAWHRQAVDPA